MPADEPTVLATSGGYVDHPRLQLAFGPLVRYAVELSGVSGRTPRVAWVGTACGDDRALWGQAASAGREAGLDLTELRLFTMPSTDDLEGFLLEQDVVWVQGGSVVNLLAVWRAHGLDGAMRRAWEAGVVLAGVSAGSICWYRGGVTDSFGPQLRPVTDGLGLLPYDNGVHYDNEETRRPAVHDLVASGVLGETHCTDDGVGLLYRGTRLVEAVTELDGKHAWLVSRDGDGDGVTETALEARRL